MFLDFTPGSVATVLFANIAWQMNNGTVIVTIKLEGEWYSSCYYANKDRCILYD
jgi:hypothetical protein